MFIVALFKIAQTWKQPNVYLQLNGQKKIHVSSYIYTRDYYLVIQKNEIMPCATTWVDLEIIKLRKESQKEKDKYHMTSLTCGI